MPRPGPWTRGPVPARFAPLLLLLGFLLPAPRCAAQPAPPGQSGPSVRPAAPSPRSRPLQPAAGAVAGARPLFRFEAAGVAEGWSRSTPPLIELSQDRWKSVERSYSPARGAERGWILAPTAGGRTEGSFRCPEDLPEGTWEWRVRLEGAEGAADSRAVPFRVDATPPAEVEGLSVRRQADGSLALSWKPVTEDIEGKPETVDHYAVYRYETLGTFPQGAPARVAEVRSPSFIDRRPPAGAGALARSPLYYKVVAVDGAGNELGLRGASGG